MKAFLLFFLLDLIFLTNESPDNLKPNSHLNAYNESSQTGRTRREYSRIRIQIHYDESIPRYSVYRKWLREAVDFFSTSVKVKPIEQPIFINRDCGDGGYMPFKNKTTKTWERFCHNISCSKVTKCAGIQVPNDHLNRCAYCKGYFDPHLCLGRENNKGSGIRNADLILYIGSVETTKCKLHFTKAHAEYCAQEGTLDRPTAGGINICKSSTQGVYSKEKEWFVKLIMREIVHILGFNQYLYNYFHDSNGIPLVQRTIQGPPPLRIDTKLATVVERKWHVRGNKITTKNAALMVTPKVVKEVRAHFNCPSLEGAELEDNNETSSERHSNWESRIFHGEVMTDPSDRRISTVFSRITFALLEDTGWYQVNYSYAEPLEFGKNLGCDFATKSCKYWMDHRSDPSPYCNKLPGKISDTCTYDGKALGKCNTALYSCIWTCKIKEDNQYFDHIDGVRKEEVFKYGGERNADYCPIVVPDYRPGKDKIPQCMRESTQSTNTNWPTDITTTQRAIAEETTTSTTGTIIAESTTEASETIEETTENPIETTAETTENPIETSGTKESSHSMEVQTKQTTANGSTTTKTDSKPTAPWTVLIIIALIVFITIFSAIAYFLFKSEKPKKSKAKKQRHRSRSRSERKARRKMTKGKDLRKGETRKEKRDGHKRRKHHRH